MFHFPTTITPADVREGDTVSWEGHRDTVVRVYPHPVLAPEGSVFAGREVYKWDANVRMIAGEFHRRVKIGTVVTLLASPSREREAQQEADVAKLCGLLAETAGGSYDY